MTDPTLARIGFAAPLTGDQAIVGVPMRQCAELAVEEINARGSAPFRWKLVAEDDRADPKVAVDVARRFVDDPAVIGVVGHKNSGPSEAAAPIYAEAGLTQMTPSSTNPALSRKGYRTFFRLCAHDTRQGEERSVVVGRGAHYVVAPDEALRVRVVCSLEERVRRYSEHEGTSLDAARKILDREDAARARFLRHNYGSDGTNPADYDLIVNTGPIPLERAAAPILAAYEAKFARRPGEAETEPLRS